MQRRYFVAGVVTVAATPPIAWAQQTTNVPRVGHLFVQPSSATGHLRDAFRQGLRELNYVEGQNITIEFRNAEGALERLPLLAADLVQRRVDVIVAAPDAAIRAARQATSTIPIVMAVADDPLGRGFVVSLARPGGNITGLSTFSPGLNGKRLELLKEIVPKLSRVAILSDADDPAQGVHLKELEVAARALKVRLQPMSVRGPSHDFEGAFRAARSEHADALITLPGALSFGHRVRIANFAATSRLPAMHSVKEVVEAGGLISYGPSLRDLHRRAATYVDKILRGGKPGDIPVEEPTKFELVINLKTAKALGLVIPPSLLLRADQVID